MANVLNVGNLNVHIYPNDHRPAHIHVRGPGYELVLILNCPDGPLELREVKGKVTNSEIRRAARLIEPHLTALCIEWRHKHGNY
jgi:hypothetical protein